MPGLQPAKGARVPILFTTHSASLGAQLDALEQQIRKMTCVRSYGSPAEEWREACLRCLRETAERQILVAMRCP